MIQFDNVSKHFGGRAAVDALTLHVQKGEFLVLIGASGSGKSTTLRMINRLIDPDQGRILFAGQDIATFQPEQLRRRIGYVIQSVGLFPHWTVARNIATVPHLLGWEEKKIEARVHELLELLQLEPARFASRYPHELSGGQQQRVGVARALAGDPEVLLMDEPFGALDPVTRVAMQQEIKRIHLLSGKTIVLVTHDIDEALALADRMVLFDEGRLVQQGTPLSLLTEPANDFVTDFLGRPELGLKRLALGTVRDAFRPGPAPDVNTGCTPLLLDQSLKEALSAFVVQQQLQLPVADGQGQQVGVLHLTDVIHTTP
jgi:osmoprotectant transport system ATP-binding protein